MNYIKFNPNVKQSNIVFNYDQPIEKQGQFGLQWNYGVNQGGVDSMISAAEGLHKKLQEIGQKIGGLKGKMLAITKVVDGKYTKWVFEDSAGNDITTTTQYPSQPQNAPQQAFQPQQAHTPIPDQFKALEDKIRAAFAARDKQIGEQMEMIMDLKQKLSYMTQLFKDHSKEAFEVHRDQLENIPVVKEDGTWADSATKELGL